MTNTPKQYTFTIYDEFHRYGWPETPEQNFDYVQHQLQAGLIELLKAAIAHGDIRPDAWQVLRCGLYKKETDRMSWPPEPFPINDPARWYIPRPDKPSIEYHLMLEFGETISTRRYFREDRIVDPTYPNYSACPPGRLWPLLKTAIGWKISGPLARYYLLKGRFWRFFGDSRDKVTGYIIMLLIALFPAIFWLLMSR